MKPKQKLKIRFIVFSSIIFVAIILFLFVSKYTTEDFNDKCVIWSAFIIGSWFWFDKKLLYFRNYLIISLLLSSTFLFAVIIFAHNSVLASFAPIPLASAIGRVVFNKKLDTMRKIDLEAKDENVEYSEGRAKMVAYLTATAIISWIINLLIKIFI